MLSPPLAKVTPATVPTPTFLPATLASSSSSPRQACHVAQRPRPSGMRPKYGMAVEGRNAPAPMVTRTAAPRMPANPRYWPARIRAVVPRWPAPRAKKRESTMMSSMLVAANRPIACKAEVRIMRPPQLRSTREASRRDRCTGHLRLLPRWHRPM